MMNITTDALPSHMKETMLRLEKLEKLVDRMTVALRSINAECCAKPVSRPSLRLIKGGQPTGDGEKTLFLSTER